MACSFNFSLHKTFTCSKFTTPSQVDRRSHGWGGKVCVCVVVVVVVGGY